jgi:Domain of unknown function (DUF1996)
MPTRANVAIAATTLIAALGLSALVVGAGADPEAAATDPIPGHHGSHGTTPASAACALIGTLRENADLGVRTSRVQSLYVSNRGTSAATRIRVTARLSGPATFVSAPTKRFTRGAGGTALRGSVAALAKGAAHRLRLTILAGSPSADAVARAHVTISYTCRGKSRQVQLHRTMNILTTPRPAAGGAGGAPSTPGAPRPGSVPTETLGSSYQSNLAMIRAQKVRNTNEDDSAYRATRSDQLVPENHYGPRSAYLGNPAGNPEQDFPVEQGGQFRTSCEFSHFAYDDPLVFPDTPGAAHLHMFFGNTDANAYSTTSSILNTGGGTCNGQELNRTAYWVPAMLDADGNARIPERIVVYYKGEGLANANAEVYPPAAAMIVKENINAISYDDGGASGKFSFVCSENYSGAADPASNTMPACDGSKFRDLYGSTDDPRMVLEMNVKFPQCWNGKDPTNPANFRRPSEGGWYYSLCNGEFNRTLPNLEYFVNYKVEIGENTRDWYLSSDVDPTSRARTGVGGSSIHADWWGGWHKQTNQTFVDNCVKLRTPGVPSGCGFGYLTNGGPDNTNPLPGPALKFRDQYTGPAKVPALTLFKELCPGAPTPANATAAAYCRPVSR